MTDVERFFRRLVNHLAATDPGRLRRPIPLDEIYRDILPYRTNRRALQLDTSEEYELVLLRLCAGEGNLVGTEPEEARARFVQELASPNPDLDVLRSFEEVNLTFRAEPLMEALEPLPDRGPASSTAQGRPAPEIVLGSAQFDAPPDASETETAATGDVDEIAEPLPDDAPPACTYCGGSLPARRPVNFCPHCGQSLTLILCPQCRSEVEPGWRHCVNCGAAVGQGSP